MWDAGPKDETFLAFDRVCELQPGESPAAKQAQLDRRLLMRNLRCVLVPRPAGRRRRRSVWLRNVWSEEVAGAFAKLEDARGSYGWQVAQGQVNP